jgi:nucleoside-diphosphate-sugar epimerase
MAARGRILLAGATGAIGMPLGRLLVGDGWTVAGTTRRAAKAGALSANGVEPLIVDVFDGDALTEAVVAFRPNIVIHQLTDLPPGLDPALMAAARVRNAYLREVGTASLLTAALAAGVERLIAQSIAFAYTDGSRPFVEDAPLIGQDGDGPRTGVVSLEHQVLTAPLVGVVLRYGRLYDQGLALLPRLLAGPCM